MKRALIEPGATADVQAAFEFYQSRREGLGLEFRQRFRQAMRLIREHPSAFPAIVDGVRWARTKQFPYKIYFLPDEDPIRVIAVLHGARDPDSWRTRRAS